MNHRGTWTVHFATRDVTEPEEVRSWLGGVAGEMVSWLDAAGIPDGLPFLLSPRFEYDTALNSYFRRAALIGAPVNSNAGRARALAGFLNFLHGSRGGRSWREATEADHLAFHQWRRRDAAGPRVSGATWSQEVSHVHQFYAWVVARGLTGAVPVPQRARRPTPLGTLRAAGGGEMVPATYAHDGR